MTVIAGYIYNHYRSVQTEVNPFLLFDWDTALRATTHILWRIRTHHQHIPSGKKQAAFFLTRTQVKSDDLVAIKHGNTGSP